MNFFDTEVTLSGEWRAPHQMLDAQVIRGGKSLHDGDVAKSLGIGGAPIEAPTHFSQFDPLAVLTWGTTWFERGCVSGHFQTMVVEGEHVRATLTTRGETHATIHAEKADGTTVMSGTASIGPNHPTTELGGRLRALGDPGGLFVVDRMQVGATMHLSDGAVISMDGHNGNLYPFTLREKLERITEPHPWYTDEGAPSSPWGRPILPIEMLSVLANKVEPPWPVRTPSIGLFLDLEIRLVAGPLFVDEPYAVDSTIVGRGQSRRTESYWTRTTLSSFENGEVVAEVLLHSGVFKESFPGYPRDRLV